MELTEAYKEDTERKIVEAIISALEANSISSNDLPLIADFVLERIDEIKTSDELIAFLSELSLKWPIFRQIQEIEQGKLKEHKEDEVARNVLDLAKTGKINDAISLAKTMTESPKI